MKKQCRSDIAFYEAVMDMLAEKDLSEIRVEDICEKAGYSRAAFYKKYKDKYDFCYQIIEREAQKYSEVIKYILYVYTDGRDAEILKKAVKEYAQYVRDNKCLYRYIYLNKFGTPSDNVFSVNCKEKILEMFESKPGDERFKPYRESFWLYRRGYLYVAIKKWTMSNFRITEGELRDCLVGLMSE